MEKIIMLFLCFSSLVVYSQEPQAEINGQVWRPFIKNFNELNTAGFMAVHSKDAVRSPRDSKTIWNWEEYNKNQTWGDQEEKKLNRKRLLELRFTERIANGNLAFDVGVYKTAYIHPDGKIMNYYGRFHVVLKKESGVWKILVDTDSSENGAIGEKDFLAARAME